MSRPARQGEGQLSDAIRAALAHEPGLLLFRNSQAVMRKGSRVYRGGLGNGSADLVGVLRVLIYGNDRRFEDGTPAGGVGRFIALEVKMPGEVPTEAAIAKLRKVPQERLDGAAARALAQWDWLAGVRERGGFAAYVDSVAGARAAIARARTGASS